MKLKLFIFLVLVLIISSCEDKITNKPSLDFKTNYFPLFIGKSIQYNVDSLVYSNFSQNGSIDTIRYQFKDSVVSFENETYFVNRYRRNQSINSWKLLKIYTVKKTKEAVLQTEDNLTFVKLVFPVLLNKKWDSGSFFNGSTNQDYEYIQIDQPMLVNQFQFDSVINVLQVDTINLIRETSANEFYAKNVGLIKIELTDLVKDSIGAFPNGTKVITTIKKY